MLRSYLGFVPCLKRVMNVLGVLHCYVNERSNKNQDSILKVDHLMSPFSEFSG